QHLSLHFPPFSLGVVSGVGKLTQIVAGPLARNSNPEKPEALKGQPMPFRIHFNVVPHTTPQSVCPDAVRWAAYSLSGDASASGSGTGAKVPFSGNTCSPSVPSVAVYHQPSRSKTLKILLSPSSKSSTSRRSLGGAA